ncbi:unnamed protein product, partial [Chrysoparadoxa australica]
MQPLLSVCCDENGSEQPTLHSSATEDAALTVARIVQGGGEALGGYWRLLVDGVASAPVAADASADDVITAMEGLPGGSGMSVSTGTADYNGSQEWQVTFHDWNDAEMVSAHIVAIDGSSMTGNGAAVSLEERGEFVLPAMQQLTNQLAFGNITACTLEGTPISPFPFNGDAGDLLEAMDSSLAEAVAVALIDWDEDDGSTWEVRFLERTITPPAIDCGAQALVNITQSASGAALGGTFSLVYGTEVTDEIEHNASAAEVQAALEDLDAIDSVLVTGGDIADANGGRTWMVEFTGPGVEGNVPALSAIPTNLTGSNPFISITEEMVGNEPGGYFSLQQDTRPTGFQDPYSGLIYAGASAEEVASAVMQLSGLSYVEASVERVLPAIGPVAWKLTFAHHDGSGLTGQSGDILQLNPFQEELSGLNATVVTSTLQEGQDVIGGSFNITRSGVSEAVPHDASAEVVAAALDALGLPSGTEVTRAASGDTGGYIWSVTLPFLESLDGDSMVVGDDELTGMSAAASAARITPVAMPLGGTFTLSFEGEETYPLPFDAEAEEMEEALEELPGLPNVTVSSTSVNDISGARDWTITFETLKLAGNQPPLGLNATGLTGSLASLALDELDGEATAMRVISSSAAFNLTVGAWELELDGDATEEEVKAAFSALGSEVVVERFPSEATAGYDWYVMFLFGEPAGLGVSGAATIGPALPGTGAAQLGGTFRLSFGQLCDTRATGVWCQPAFTAPIAVGAGADDVEAALELLPDIKDVDVTASERHGFHSGPAIVSVEHAYDITFEDVKLGVSDTAVANEFEWTWTGEKAAVDWSEGIVIGGDLPSLGFDAETLLGSRAEGVVEEGVKGLFRETGSSVPVEVTQNGQDYTGSGIMFEYQSVISVESLEPRHGPVSGGTEVLVRGEGFSQGSKLMCRFGEATARALRFLDSNTIVCAAPAALISGPVAVEVSNNGAAFSETGVLYQYDTEIEIARVLPHLGPSSGNFSVNVIGGPFEEEGELLCRFGAHVVPAEYVSVEQLHCMAPAHQEGQYALEVSGNGQDFTLSRFPFFFFRDQELSRLTPVSGPAGTAGTEVTLFGEGFVDSALTMCRFGGTLVPARHVSSQEIVCSSPPLYPEDGSGGLSWTALSEQRQRLPSPLHGSDLLFPDAHYYPLYLQRLVTVEVTNNGQDFTDSGITYLYQADAEVTEVHRNGDSLFVQGDHFVNSTALGCRVGTRAAEATFLSRQLLLCNMLVESTLQPAHGLLSHGEMANEIFPHAPAARPGSSHTSLYVEVTNNGLDFTSNQVEVEVPAPCAAGHFCPTRSDVLPCPQGAFCPGEGNGNFTFCPRGTYQPRAAQTECMRCPIGFQCPEFGMHVPRICPAGKVCDVTGTEAADQPCPAGHFCLEGTATTATTCGHPTPSSRLFPSLSHAERASTKLPWKDPTGHDLVLGARATGCWTNGTEDFGLQMGSTPARFWMEMHSLPLDQSTPFTPLRGRYCLDDRCMRLEDEDDFQSTDYAFDYSGYNLRRPVPCPAGTYCHPGTAVDQLGMHDYSMPQPCMESMYCPEGSISPSGVGECPAGSYCPSGKRIPCPVGTYCPRAGHWDPMPCPPGTFNAMVGQLICTKCPRGYMCPGFGRIDPAVCPAGMVCSRTELTAPNLRCPPGYYCQDGTITSDPFRNDTTLRPMPCSPGSYCLGGVGSVEAVQDDYFYAQPCPAGFYCELASTSPRGSGLCPLGFYCPTGTAVPIPSPKGSFSPLEGTIEASKCLPGYYAPTIESANCYPCPPGTRCEEEGMFIADICPPGTYRSTTAQDGLPCAACPQGTWSKNWELREVGECQWCPTGMVCSVEGMVQPCSIQDLPTPYEPLVKIDDIPQIKYLYSSFDRVKYFSAYECLRLNDGYADGTMDPASQIYFYGELIPPYIDKLGRGPHFRSTDQDNVLYQETAGCYRNTQRFGSKVYQRMRDYYGPQYDIQHGESHQGYGHDDDYQGFWGKGSLYIDLPKARKYDAAFNCTSGFLLMDETTLGAAVDLETTVYTDVMQGPQEAMNRIADTWFPGTCEADIICNAPEATQAEACPEGYVCEERTTSEMSVFYPCREGYVCDFGTTPDPDLEAPEGQFTQLCPAGYVCRDATGLGQARRQVCPANYFCPTGTADIFMGRVADDAVNRGLDQDMSDPFASALHLKYLADDDVRVVSGHDLACFQGVDSDLSIRYRTRWLTEAEESNDPFLSYLAYARPDLPPYKDIDGVPSRPSVVNVALEKDLNCARDHKWRLVSDIIARDDCDCVSQVYVISQVFRLWKCSGGELDNLGVASLHPDYNGGRDFWFDRTSHTATRCTFDSSLGSDIPGFSLTAGAIPTFEGGLLEVDLAAGVPMRFSWLETRTYHDYASLKEDVEAEYNAEYAQIAGGERDNMDPYVYDLNAAVRYVEEFGERLEDLVGLQQPQGSDELVPYRLDMCECQRLLRCPNGTISSEGSTSVLDCEANKEEVLRRVNVVPDRYMHDVNFTTHSVNGTALTEITGKQEFTLGALRLDSLEVATISLDVSQLQHNMTYGKHYQLSIYLDCKPCPTQYRCNLEGETPTCSYPPLERQEEQYQECLEREKILSCFVRNGTIVPC